MSERCDRPEGSRNGYFSPYRCTLPLGHREQCKWTDSPVTTKERPADWPWPKTP